MVREMALLGRVHRDPRYHAHEEGIPFARIATALSWCHRVQKDGRTDDAGIPLHPDGYIALCGRPRGGLLRVDFNLGNDEAGLLIRVVAAMEVPRA